MSQLDRDDRPHDAALLSRQKNRLSPKKLLLSKWTAVTPLHKEKHFVVIRVIEPELPDVRIDQVEVEAIHSRRTFLVHWRELTDTAEWRQGWV
ncbi:MAG: TIGR02450 family Trp-rich protein [Chitinophagaceae bacterium]|nr:TIGR02450 family Trp-rich protein [Rubrivivax sp.]